METQGGNAGILPLLEDSHIFNDIRSSHSGENILSVTPSFTFKNSDGYVGLSWIIQDNVYLKIRSLDTAPRNIHEGLPVCYRGACTCMFIATSLTIVKK